MEAFGHCGFIFVVDKELDGHGRPPSRIGARILMFSSIVKNFSKREDCPSSQELIDYQNGLLSPATEGEVVRHLIDCDFCSAETEFYSCFGDDDLSAEIEEPVQIPAPLFELAEALLKKRHNDADSLNSMFRKRGVLLIDPV